MHSEYIYNTSYCKPVLHLVLNHIVGRGCRRVVATSQRRQNHKTVVTYGRRKINAARGNKTKATSGCRRPFFFFNTTTDCTTSSTTTVVELLIQRPLRTPGGTMVYCISYANSHEYIRMYTRSNCLSTINRGPLSSLLFSFSRSSGQSVKSFETHVEDRKTSTSRGRRPDHFNARPCHTSQF